MSHHLNNESAKLWTSEQVPNHSFGQKDHFFSFLFQLHHGWWPQGNIYPPLLRDLSLPRGSSVRGKEKVDAIAYLTRQKKRVDLFE